MPGPSQFHPALAHSAPSQPNCKAEKCISTFAPPAPATHSSPASALPFTPPTPPRGSSHGHQVLAVLESCRSPALTLGQCASWCRPPFPSTSSPGFLHILLGLPLYCPCQLLGLACTPPVFPFKSWCCSGLCREPSALHTPLVSRCTHLLPHPCPFLPKSVCPAKIPFQVKTSNCLLHIPFRSLADTTLAVPTFTRLYSLPSLYILLFRGCQYLLIFSCPSRKSGI